MLRLTMKEEYPVQRPGFSQAFTTTITITTLMDLICDRAAGTCSSMPSAPLKG